MELKDFEREIRGNKEKLCRTKTHERTYQSSG